MPSREARECPICHRPGIVNLSQQLKGVHHIGGQERFKVLSEKELVKIMMYLVWELNPWFSVHEADTLPSELMRFYICQAGFEPTTFRTTV